MALDPKRFFQRAGIPVPERSIDGLYPTVVALKEAMDVLINQRGDPNESAVLRRDNVLWGLMANAVYPFTIPPRDDYVPGLSFNLLDTGITYDVQAGRWLRIGSLVFFTWAVRLTSKGTATGPAMVSLPYPSRPTPDGVWFWNARTYNMAGSVDQIGFRIPAGSAAGELWVAKGTGPPAQITDSNFTATSELGCSGFYEAYVETTSQETDTRGMRLDTH